MAPPNKLPSLVGQTFTRLCVLREAERNKHGHRQWECLCVCGKTVIVLQNLLRSGATKSCGCLHREVTAAMMVTHGHARTNAHTAEYRTWRGMLARCEIRSATHFAAYGGKGVKVCVGWHTFEAFLADMGFRPSSSHSIDRMNNDRGYDCGRCDDCKARGATLNCRWATPEEQSRNRGVTKFVEHNGQHVTLVALAHEHAVSYHALYRRLSRGQALAKALAALTAKKEGVAA
jgi:hypothetical protein